MSGTILTSAAPVKELLAIDDPALFAASALRDALEARGVRITGEARAVHRRAGEDPPVWSGVELAAHESAPLSEILQVINKVSQNLHAELLLREISRAKNGPGSREDGFERDRRLSRRDWRHARAVEFRRCFGIVETDSGHATNDNEGSAGHVPQSVPCNMGRYAAGRRGRRHAREEISSQPGGAAYTCQDWQHQPCQCAFRLCMARTAAPGHFRYWRTISTQSSLRYREVIDEIALALLQ